MSISLNLELLQCTCQLQLQHTCILHYYVLSFCFIFFLFFLSFLFFGLCLLSRIPHDPNVVCFCSTQFDSILFYCTYGVRVHFDLFTQFYLFIFSSRRCRHPTGLELLQAISYIYSGAAHSPLPPQPQFRKKTGGKKSR